MLAKAKGAVLVLHRFGSLTRRIYLFGTSKKLKFEVERELSVKWYIIMPESRMRMTWNFIVLLLLMYTATITPYRTAFVDNDDGSAISIFEIFVDTMYIVDLFLNFFMAYEDRDKKIEIRLKFIAENYIRTWFFLDFLACIPFQYLEPPEQTTA